MPNMPSSSQSGSETAGNSSENADGDGDDGIDVNVSVAGQTVPVVGMPGMPGLPGEGGMPGMPGMPGAGMPGMPGAGMPGMPGSSSGMPGMPGSSSGMPGSSSGLPGADGTGSMPSSGMPGSTGGIGRAGGGNGPMTTAERRAVLDGRLEEGYAVFDGMILGERERAQRDADAAGAGVMSPGGAGGEDGDGGVESGAGGAGGMGNSPTIIASNGASRGSGAGVMGAGAGRQGEYDAENAVATYPVPEDIPSGNDDDVVARQLREAAMREPDPELREKLWDEYRKYTGLSQ